MKLPPSFYASELHRAMTGLATDETALIEILCSLNNFEISVIRREYESSEFKNIFDIKLLSEFQNMDFLEYGTSFEEDIKDTTSHHLKKLLVLLCCGSRCELVNVNSQAVSHDVDNLCQAGEIIFQSFDLVCKCLTNPMKYNLLEKCRPDTEESMFVAIFASRSFAHLRRVFSEYRDRTGCDIKKAIEDEFFGDIKEALLALGE